MCRRPSVRRSAETVGLLSGGMVRAWIEDEPQETLRERLAGIATRVARGWGTARPIYFDFSLFPPTGPGEGSPIELLFAVARQRRLVAIPVTGPPEDRGPGNHYLRSIRHVATKDGRGLAIRLRYSTFSYPKDLIGALDMIQEQVNVADQGTDLVLDLESLERLPENERNEDALCDVLSEALVALRPRHLRSVIVCASSFPEKTPRTVGGDPLRLVRLEVPVWRALVHQSKLRTVLFGDYGVVFPQEVDPEGRVIPPSKIRLSTATSHALFKGPPGAYLELCQDAYRTGDLPEAVTCWGTREIWACLRCNSAHAG